MPPSYHASGAKAKSALFLLSAGLPGLAEPLPVGTDRGKTLVEPLLAQDVAIIPALGAEIADRAPFIPLVWGKLPLHGKELQPLRAGEALVCGECSSSLDVAMHLALAGLLPEWSSVLAVSQRGGRGQLRREWSSPPGNIYAALRLPDHGLFSGWNAALTVGWMLVLAFRAFGLEMFLKWPNDLLLCCDDAWGKAGGILLEERGGILLAGVGINVSSAPDLSEMRPEGAMRAIALREAGYDFSVLGLWEDLVQYGQSLYIDWSAQKKGGVDLRSAEAVLAWNNRRVIVSEAGVGEYCGLLKGLDADGRLRLAVQSGEIFLTSGMIRLMG